MGSSMASMYSAEDIPQDPFYPEEIPPGPAFLDTQACLCAYKQTPLTNSEDAAWECIGNQTQRIKSFTGGKWFRPLHSATVTNATDEVLGAIWDASNGPDLKDALMYNADQDALVAVDDSKLSAYEAACTGANQTTFSTAFYRSVSERENNETMVDAAPCYRPLAVPVQIMELDAWQQDGCNEGFICTHDALPPSAGCKGPCLLTYFPPCRHE